MLSRALPFLALSAVLLHCSGTADPNNTSGGGDCASLMNDHDYSCGTEGERCESPVQDACVGAATLYCTCENGKFVCDVPKMDCGGPTCPSPDQVKPGAACSYSTVPCASTIPITDCDGNVTGYEQCSCGSNGMYECTSPPTPPCAIDAGVAE